MEMAQPDPSPSKACRDCSLFRDVDPSFLESLICSIGKGVLMNPKRNSCGHAFCSDCLDSFEGTMCPVCTDKPIEKDKITKDFLLTNLIGNLKSSCDNASRGCSWIGKFSDISYHRSSDCPFELVKCPFQIHGCTFAELQRKDLESHLKDDAFMHLQHVCAKLGDQESTLKSQREELCRLTEELHRLQDHQVKIQSMHKQALAAIAKPFAPPSSSADLESSMHGTDSGPDVIPKPLPLPAGDRDLYLVSQTDPTLVTYRWRLENFSKIRKKELQSDDFTVGNLSWFLRVSAPEDNLQVYLRVPHTIVSYPRDWKAYVQMSFGVINQMNEKKSVWRYTSHTFDQNSVSWGYANFLSIAELYAPDEHFVVDDVLIIEVTVKIFPEEL